MSSLWPPPPQKKKEKKREIYDKQIIEKNLFKKKRKFLRKGTTLVKETLGNVDYNSSK